VPRPRPNPHALPREPGWQPPAARWVDKPAPLTQEEYARLVAACPTVGDDDAAQD
jgi:hypothetical protein